MCRREEAATQGQAAAAGSGKKGRRRSATTLCTRPSSRIEEKWSSPSLTRAFQPACRSAAPSTAAKTGSSTSALPEALGGLGPAFALGETEVGEAQRIEIHELRPRPRAPAPCGKELTKGGARGSAGDARDERVRGSVHALLSG